MKPVPTPRGHIACATCGFPFPPTFIAPHPKSGKPMCPHCRQSCVVCGTDGGNLGDRLDGARVVYLVEAEEWRCTGCGAPPLADRCEGEVGISADKRCWTFTNLVHARGKTLCLFCAFGAPRELPS